MAWKQVSMRIDVIDGMISATFNGITVNASAPLASQPVSGAEVLVDVGIGYISSALGGWSVRCDDVVVRAD